MARSGWAAAALVMALVSTGVAPRRAKAQSTTAPPTLPNEPRLPPLPRLQLTWPVAPLGFSFSQQEVGGYAIGPLQLFRAEALWLETPALRLLSVASAERAFELDCRLTCQPVVQRALALEARVPLPRLGPVVSNPYAFIRSSSFYTSQNPHFTRQLSAGFAGALNF